MTDFKNKGKSIIYVSHSMSQIKRFCNKVLWIEAGRIKAFGETEEVLKYYNKFMKFWKKLNSDEKLLYKEKAYTVPISKIVDNEKLFLYDLGIERYDWISENDNVKNFFSSRVVSFKARNTKIFKDVRSKEDFELSEKYIDRAFYSKKSAHFKDEVYLLLSDKQSYEESLIGWVNIKNLNHYDLTFISDTKKNVVIKGSGKAYNKPLGKLKDESMFVNVANEKDGIMEVRNSYLIDKKHIWYEGLINKEYVWINSIHTTER